MTSITKTGTKGETSGVLIVDGFRITVGDEGDLTITDITDPNAESINFNIEGIGFEDLSLNGVHRFHHAPEVHPKGSRHLIGHI